LGRHRTSAGDRTAAAASGGAAAPAPPGLLAGVGSTVSLIAAAAVAASAITGTIAFTSWPGAPSGSGGAEVRLAVLDVPAALAASQASFAAAAGDAGAAAVRRPAGAPGGARARTGRVVGRAGPGITPASIAPAQARREDGAPPPAQAGGPAPSLVTPALTPRSVGTVLGTGVTTGTGDVAGETQPVAPRTSGLLATAGEVAGKALGDTGGALGEFLRLPR